MWKYLNRGISTPIAIGIILILVIIVGGFTWWQYAEIRKSETNIPEVQIPEKKEVKDETTDWETYISPGMGFSIKYPIDWEVNPEIPEDNGKRMSFSDPSNPLHRAEFTITRGTGSYFPTFEELLENERNVAQSGTDPEEKHISLDGYPAIALSYTEDYIRAVGGNIRIIHILEKENEIEMFLTIENFDESNKAKYFPIFDQMLSTFKFID